MSVQRLTDPGHRVLERATIGQIQNCDIAGRDIVAQEGTNNVIGNNNVFGNQTILLGNPNSCMSLMTLINADRADRSAMLVADPIQRLLFYCALDALVDSKERHDSEQFLPPRCAPETRDAIFQKIIRWVNEGTSAPDFLWLTGSAGSGKSAICQSISEIFLKKGTLLANFFFSRGAGSSGRSNGYRLLPTLIWQIQQSMPETRSKIKATIRKGSSVLSSTHATQMDALCCRPLNQKSLRRWLRELFGRQIRLIVIDGLDECQGTGVQCDLLHALADTAATLALPIRFLIASRPEAHIKHTFYNHPSLKAAAEGCINLDELQDADSDISVFVQARFYSLRKTHPMAAYLDPSWPSDEEIAFVISKSSPQFIFASTVMNYISSPDDRPDHCLRDIISKVETKSSGTREAPLENLDKLYRFIFSSIKPKYRSSVRIILGIIYLAGRREFQVPTPSPLFFEELFRVPAGMVSIMLTPLFSIISIPKDRNMSIRSLHASLFDFLLDSQRSKDTVLDLLPAHSCLLYYYGQRERQLSGPPTFFLGIQRHAILTPIAEVRRPLIDHIITEMLCCFGEIPFGMPSMPEEVAAACKAIQIAFDVLERYREAGEEDSGRSWLSERLSSYERLSANRLLGFQNPFVRSTLRDTLIKEDECQCLQTCPISKLKYCAFVSLAQTFSYYNPDDLWRWLSKSPCAPTDAETLMHLITAFTDVTAQQTSWSTVTHKHFNEALVLLIRVASSFAPRDPKLRVKVELRDVCCRSVIRFCKHLRCKYATDQQMKTTARRCRDIWTRVKVQQWDQEGSVSG